MAPGAGKSLYFTPNQGSAALEFQENRVGKRMGFVGTGSHRDVTFQRGILGDGTRPGSSGIPGKQRGKRMGFVGKGFDRNVTFQRGISGDGTSPGSPAALDNSHFFWE